MTMVWMRMPGETWLAAGGKFLAMWTELAPLFETPG